MKITKKEINQLIKDNENYQTIHFLNYDNESVSIYCDGPADYYMWSLDDILDFDFHNTDSTYWPYKKDIIDIIKEFNPIDVILDNDIDYKYARRRSLQNEI